MKNVLLLASILIFGFSCKKDKKAESENLAQIGNEQQTEEETWTNTAIGYWISAPYAKSVLGNLSPYKSISKLGTISEATIDEENLFLIYHNAEGQILAYSLQNPGEDFSLVAGDIKVEMKSDDELKIDYKGETIHLIRSEQPLVGQHVLSQFIRSRIFAGTYQSLDAKVVFHSDGRIEGFEPFTNYKIYNIFEALADFDLIELTNAEGKKVFATYLFKKDQLILYRVKDGSEFIYQKGEEWTRFNFLQGLT